MSMNAEDLIEEMRERMREAEENAIELQRLFQARWHADMRATNIWQRETGRRGVWPDHADMVLWLLQKLDAHGLLLPEPEDEPDEAGHAG